ncbi:Catabolic 3-dehydroquinate dehydratase [bacterium HR30]|nr:Catabolic 3-dehydroquinate dehydratase [bacterium HR30]
MKKGESKKPSSLQRLVGLPGERPKVILAVKDDLSTVRRLCRPGVDVLELRIDQFGSRDPAHLERTAAKLQRFGRPLLATVRSATEGGAVKLPDPLRAELWRAVLPRVAAIDVEVRSVGKLSDLCRDARERGCTIVLSYHDFRRTPSMRELEALYQRARAAGADVVKLAVWATAPHDVWRVAAFTWEHRAFPLVTMTMGPLGPLSRLLLPLFGSRWVYTSVVPAHGQIPLFRLLSDLRFYFP